MTTKKMSAISLAALFAAGVCVQMPAIAAAHTGASAPPASGATMRAIPATPAASAIPKGEGITRPATPATPSANSRADVKADATAANKDGKMKSNEGPTRPVTPGSSVKSRAEVKSETAGSNVPQGGAKGPDVPASGVKKP